VVDVAGAYGGCVILSSSPLPSIKCWGNGGDGRLGYGDTNDRGDSANEMGDYLPFVDIGNGVDVVDIKAGSGWFAILTSDGKMKAWGKNDDGSCILFS